MPGMVGVSWFGAGGARQAVSDANGVVSLGKLPMGVAELTVDARKVAGGTGQPQLLIGLLLPAVQSARETVVLRSIPFPASRELHLKLGVMMDGKVSSISFGDGMAAVAVGDFVGDGRADFTGGVRVAAGDVDGDGYVKAFGDPAKAGAPGETKIGFFVPGNGGNGGDGAAPARRAEPAVFGQSVTFTATLSKVGVTVTGPGGVSQLLTNEQGVARLGKLGMGDMTLEVSGTDLASALKTAGGPTKPVRQETLIELLIVIALVANRADGDPIILGPVIVALGTWPADAFPKSLKADLRVGRDGNLMAVNWGNGPQGPITTQAEIFQNVARQGKPGETALLMGLVTKDSWTTKDASKK